MRKMRFTLLFAALFCSGFAYAVTLHDLTFRLSYDKHVFPGRLLRGDLEYTKMMVQAVYYYKEALFTGTVMDTSLEFIEATFDKGKIVSYRRDWDASNYYRYNVTSSDLYSWYAADALIENGTIIRQSEYYLNALGYYRSQVNTSLNDGGYLIVRFSLSKQKRRKIVFTEPFPDGIAEWHYTTGYVSYQEYRDGIEKGLYEQRDSTGRVIDRVYSAYDSIGMYGEYMHIDEQNNTITIGQYDNGFATGVWITRDLSTNRVIEKEWHNSRSGESDSTKVWYPDGQLFEVRYSYYLKTETGERHQVCFAINYYESGQRRCVDYNDNRDTLRACFLEDGKPFNVRRKFGNQIQYLAWNPGTTQLLIEQYQTIDFYRDSVWREWDFNGELVLEKYYDKGRYIRTSVNRKSTGNNSPYPGLYFAATMAIVADAQQNPRAWDTSGTIPPVVIDSVALNITRVINFNQYNNQHEISAPGMQEWYCMGNSNTIYYNLIIQDADSCSFRDKQVVTDNPRLNAFLDSAGFSSVLESPSIFGEGMTPGKLGKTKRYFVIVRAGDSIMNISFINRRLAAIQPGSYIEIHRTGEPTYLTESDRNPDARIYSTYPATVLYFPQGTPTQNGKLPFTVIAMAGEATRTTNYWGEYDPRYYVAWIVYGDGDVQYFQHGNATSIYSNLGIPLPKRSDRPFVD